MTVKTDFDVLKKRLSKALRLGGDAHTVEDIQHAIARGEMQCFVHGDSFVITEIATTPRAKYINVFLAVGDLSLMAIQKDLIIFARKMAACGSETVGATRVEIGFT